MKKFTMNTICPRHIWVRNFCRTHYLKIPFADPKQTTTLARVQLIADWWWRHVFLYKTVFKYLPKAGFGCWEFSNEWNLQLF